MKTRREVVLWASPLVTAAIVAACFWPLATRHAREPHAELPLTTVGQAMPPAALTSAEMAEYAGSQSCQACHAEIFADYSTSAMSRSWRKIGTPLPDSFTKSVPVSAPDGYQYRLVVEGDRVFQEETSAAPAGEHRRSQEAKYLVGSGVRTLAMVSEHNGYLCQMPLGWFAGSNEWKLSPGYELYNWRFGRPIAPGCIACHGSEAVHRSPTRNRYDLPLADGIGCERCHGPGREHVEHWESADKVTESNGPDKTVVNPAHLASDRTNDVCLQCHLQGDVTVYPEGAHAYSFRPGDRLTDHRLDYLLKTDSPDELGIASHGSRMMQSRCYQDSGGKLTCTLCHDPHRPASAFQPAYYDNKCLTCHSEQSCTRPPVAQPAERGSSCTGCHMPRRTTFESQHVAMTDHWIRRRPGTPAKSVSPPSVPASAELVSAWPQSAADPAHLGAAYVLLHETMGPRPEALDRAIELLGPAGSAAGSLESKYWLASALISRYRSREAAPILNRLLEARPDWHQARFRLGIAYDQLRNYTNAVTQYEQVIERSPDWMEPYVLLARLYLFQRDFASAARLLKQQLSYQEDAAAYANLALAERLSGGPLPDSLALIDKALKLDPRLVAGFLNRAVLLAEAGQRDQAREDYERVLSIEPNNATARAGLAALKP